MKLLVKNGMIATESQVFQGDILIEDEKIIYLRFYQKNTVDMENMEIVNYEKYNRIRIK